MIEILKHHNEHPDWSAIQMAFRKQPFGFIYSNFCFSDMTYAKKMAQRINKREAIFRIAIGVFSINPKIADQKAVFPLISIS